MHEPFANAIATMAPEDERQAALNSYRAKLIESREWEAKLKNLRIEIKELQKEFDRTEENIKALQSVGQIIGEVLKQLDDERFIVKASSGPRYVVGCRSKVDKAKLKQGTRVALDMTTLTIMRMLPREVDPLVYNMSLEDPGQVSFAGIGGLNDQIRELREVIELPLKNPELFLRVGIKPPKGVLLYGPPGTGKTLLARAVASSLETNFLKVVSSAIVDKYIGESARLIREMFGYAKEHEPCIIFMDEIDAIGGRRFSEGTSADREIQRTLMELLNQLDGFDYLGKTKIIMATNRPDTLDPALLRAGRLDRKIEIPLPNEVGRLEILKIHASSVVQDGDIDFESVVKMSDGLNGADLRNVVTEAGLFAIKDYRESINQDDFNKAVRKVAEAKKLEVIKSNDDETKDTIYIKQTARAKQIAGQKHEVIINNRSTVKRARGGSDETDRPKRIRTIENPFLVTDDNKDFDALIIRLNNLHHLTSMSPLVFVLGTKLLFDHPPSLRHQASSISPTGRNASPKPRGTHQADGLEAASCAGLNMTKTTRLLDSHGLGQVSGEVHVKTLENSQPVGNQLQGNDVEDTLKAVDRLWDFDLLSLGGLELLVTGVADDNGLAAASNDCVERLLEKIVTSEDHDDGKVLVDQGEDTVLQLTRHDSLAVKEERLLVLENLLAEILDGLVELEDLLDLVRHVGQTLDDLLAASLLGGTVLAERQGEHDHGNELGGVSLGGGNTDLRAGVDVDTTVGEQGDGRADNVDDTDGEGATLQAVAESHQRIGSLTRLGHEDASVVTEDGSLSIEEVGRQLDGDGDLSQLFEDTTDSHARVVAGTASNENDSAATTNRGDVRAKATEGDRLVGHVQTTTHGVDDGLGLLENLLLHEVVELALHDLLQLELQGLDGSDVGAAVGLLQAVDVEGTLVDVGNVVILEVHDLLGVLDNGRRVGREEELGGHGHAIVGHEGSRLRAVEERLVWGTEQGVVGGKEVGGVLLEGNVLRSSLGGESGVLVGVLDVNEVNLHAAGGLDTNNKGRTLAGSNNLVGVVNGLDQQAVGTLKLLNDSLGKVGHANVRVLVMDVLGQLGNALSISLSLELEALADQESLKLLVVGDDAIVDDGELPAGVDVGLVNELLELGYLADLLEREDLLLLVAVDG
ncbi:proteasome regulatory particle subunit Rpt4 [Paramyrothecium foliicola]|nr:proteasome regulatory particle subunit Rpt4 [Paramyrothecium foliicola]